jgi:voltage-gated sodium channel
MKFAQQADMICAAPSFTYLITLTIIAAGAVVGVQTEINSSSVFLDVMDILILTIFTAEVVLKIMSEGDRPLKYFNDNWNCFDFFIVFACFIFMLPFMPDVGSMLAMLRLLRLLRVLKLVKALPQLRVIIEALISGFGSITFVTVMLFLLFYLFANIGIIFFGENDPMHFGNLQVALVSLFVISTLDDWTDVMYNNMLGCDQYGYSFGRLKLGFDDKADENYLNCSHPRARGWIAALFMIVFIVFGSLVMLNLFIGIVATAMEEAKSDQREEAKLDDRLKLYKELLHIDEKQFKLYEAVFDELDVKNEKKLDGQDLKLLVRCLSVLHFATALMDDSHKSGNDKEFKVMNKRDIEHFVQFIHSDYYG